MNFLGWLSALLVLVNVGRLHDAFARFTGPIPAGKILLLCGLVGFLFSPSIDRIAAAFRTTQGKALLAFTVALYLSGPFSYHRSATLELALMFVSASIPIVLITIAGVRSIRDLEKLFRAAVLLVVLVSVIIAAGFGIVTDGGDGPRTTLSGAYDPNDLAMVIASCMAFCIWVIKDRSVLWRLLGFAGLAGGTYVVVRTYSRGGALALGALLFLAIFVVKGAVPKWFRASLVPLALVAFLLSPGQYRDRLGTIGSKTEDYNQTAESGRIKIWKRGVGYFLGRPLTGVGAGQFSFAEGKWGESHGFTAGWKWSAPHNMYVEAAAEMGILGIGGLLGMLLPTLRRTWRTIRTSQAGPQDEREVRAAGAIFLAMSTFMVGAVFLTAAFSPVFMFVVSIGIAFESLPRRVFNAAKTRETDAASVPRVVRHGGAVRRASRWTGRQPAPVGRSSV